LKGFSLAVLFGWYLLGLKGFSLAVLFGWYLLGLKGLYYSPVFDSLLWVFVSALFEVLPLANCLTIFIAEIKTLEF
jgi:hypothetical protein